MKTSFSREGHRIPTLSTGSMSAFLDHLRLQGRSERTIQTLRNALRQFSKFWGDRDLREARGEDLEGYAKATLGRVSRESAYLYINAVRQFFRFLVERGVLLVDPSAGMPVPRMRDRLTGRILTRDEMKRLVESPDPSTTVGLRDRALLEFLYSTGLRVTENRKLLVTDLGVDSVTVRTGKGGKDRVVPVGISAMRWVRRYLAEAKPIFARRPGVPELWISRWGRPFGEQMFQIHLRKLGDSAGIDHLTCHAIRRSMATHLLAAGASPSEVSGILGHSDLHSLSRYIQVAAREVKETHEKTHPRES